MAHLSISEVGRRVGLRASAIRFYEQVGILPPARRVSGQRRYDRAAVYRLAVVRRAQEAGFSLSEIRELLAGFQGSTPVSARWGKLAQRKLSELEAEMERIRRIKELLERIQAQCRCDTVDECGAAILPGIIERGRQGPASVRTRTRLRERL